MIFRRCRPANAGFLRFRCSRTSSTLRSGSRQPAFSARPDLNPNASGPAFRVDTCRHVKRRGHP
ncbi:MAG: hypothetical protein EOR68_25980 [Mesorhizobium sp.]|nr:MAG: hypothetical protein EOR69_25795 [Mesorhizobium sp.]RWL83114.1 MAG: hypothetical protein EOR67_25640 [Mesorhizobium sp.]RWL92600.1 MAG: hypothetical protein EOR68_25980 [Mesorhizobium sp.]RWL94031.1 MAG: hypothetical protein EOR70_27040 [Mesorhizobium sp.]TIP33557.1 MAG: hypothetical protein E5X77_41455 [Mesorhizobium sp.]